MSSMTTEEIIVSLGLNNMGVTRAINTLRDRNLTPWEARKIFAMFDGATEVSVDDTTVLPAVRYLVSDILTGKPAVVQSAVERAATLVREQAWAFKEDVPEVDYNAPRPAVVTVGADGETVVTAEPVKLRRGRPAAGRKSAMELSGDLFDQSPDKSKPVIIELFQKELGLNFGTAQTYYYAHRKRVAK